MDSANKAAQQSHVSYAEKPRVSVGVNFDKRYEDADLIQPDDTPDQGPRRGCQRSRGEIKNVPFADELCDALGLHG